MFQIILIAVVVVLVVLFWSARREARRHGTSMAEEFVGICTVAVDRTVRKQGNMEKIMSLFARSTSSGQAAELSNFEIRKALGVSSRTAVRYMDELEKEGRVEQVGKIGHTVTYRVK